MKGISKKTGYFLTAVLAAAFGVLCSSAARNDFPLGRDLRILFNMFRDVSLCYVDSVDTEKLLLAAADGMCGQLDPYTELIPEKEMADFEIQTTGKYGGIGALIRMRGDYAAIARPYEGFAADRAGLVHRRQAAGRGRTGPPGHGRERSQRTAQGSARHFVPAPGRETADRRTGRIFDRKRARGDFRHPLLRHRGRRHRLYRSRRLLGGMQRRFAQGLRRTEETRDRLVDSWTSGATEAVFCKRP